MAAAKKVLKCVSLSASFECGTAPGARATAEASTAGICRSQSRLPSDYCWTGQVRRLVKCCRIWRSHVVRPVFLLKVALMRVLKCSARGSAADRLVLMLTF
jgi:hypothetical protein